MNADREHAQQLLNHLAPDQVAAVVHVMEVMLDPLSRRLANAPLEDEEISEEEERAVAASKEWFKNNRRVPMEGVLAELGLAMADPNDSEARWQEKRPQMVSTPPERDQKAVVRPTNSLVAADASRRNGSMGERDGREYF
jgi:hypothetical protein